MDEPELKIDFFFFSPACAYQIHFIHSPHVHYFVISEMKVKEGL